MLPFSREQFLTVFADYNVAIWPAQLVAYALGAVVLLLLFRPAVSSGRLILAILAVMWLWTGISYHFIYFSRINTAAPVFAGLFIVQALALAASVFRGEKQFSFPRDSTGWIGAALAVYAAVLYPLVGLLAGHTYPAVPMFGVTPCPVTIFTLGILLLQEKPIGYRLLIVPVIWSIIGGSAALLLGIPQDWGLLVGGAAVIIAVVMSNRTLSGRARI
jgi:hypothetical protein